MAKFVIIEHDASFMECDVEKFVIASTNKQKLESIAAKLKILEPESSFCVKEFKGDNTFMRYQSSDENYCMLHDVGLGLVSDEEARRLQKEYAADASGWMEAQAIEIRHSISNIELSDLLSEYKREYREHLTGTYRKKKAIRNGLYWSSPEKYDTFQGQDINIQVDGNWI